MKRTTALIATLLALVVVSLPSVASAASLNVRGAVLTTVTARGCDDAVEVRPDARKGVLTTGYTNAFEIRDVAPRCAGRKLEVVVFDSAGASLGTATIDMPQQLADGIVYVTLRPVDTRGVFLPDVAGAAATAGSWGVRTSWVLPGTALPLVVCRTESDTPCSPTVSRSTSPEGTWRIAIEAEGYLRGDELFINLARVGTGPGTVPFRAESVDVTGGGWFIWPPAEVRGWRCASSTLLVFTPGGYNFRPVVITGFSNGNGDEAVPACA